MNARMGYVGVAAVCICFGLTGCSSGVKSEQVGATEVAATVVAASGAVSFERAGESKPLAVGDSLRRGDVIVTGADGTVTVKLLHNNARWTLSAGKRKQVDQSVAWRAPTSASGSALAASRNSESTAAAGRHAEKQAAATRATAALVAESARVEKAENESPGVPAPSVPSAPAPESVVRQGPPVRTRVAKSPGAAPPPPPRKAGRKRRVEGAVSSSPRRGGNVAVLKAADGSSPFRAAGVGRGGSGSGAGYGAGLGSKERKASAVRVRTAVPTVTGELSSDIIRRVLRRHIPAIRHCYEQALAKVGDKASKHALVKIVSEFTIVSNGAVSGVKISGDPFPAMDACIKSRMKRIKFPKPRGGGTVTVRYPMVFSSAAK